MSILKPFIIADKIERRIKELAHNKKLTTIERVQLEQEIDILKAQREYSHEIKRLEMKISKLERGIND